MKGTEPAEGPSLHSFPADSGRDACLSLSLPFSLCCRGRRVVLRALHLLRASHSGPNDPSPLLCVNT